MNLSMLLDESMIHVDTEAVHMSNERRLNVVTSFLRKFHVTLDGVGDHSIKYWVNKMLAQPMTVCGYASNREPHDRFEDGLQTLANTAELQGRVRSGEVPGDQHFFVSADAEDLWWWHEGPMLVDIAEGVGDGSTRLFGLNCFVSADGDLVVSRIQRHTLGAKNRKSSTLVEEKRRGDRFFNLFKKRTNLTPEILGLLMFVRICKNHLSEEASVVLFKTESQPDRNNMKSTLHVDWSGMLADIGVQTEQITDANEKMIKVPLRIIDKLIQNDLRDKWSQKAAKVYSSLLDSLAMMQNR